MVSSLILLVRPVLGCLLHAASNTSQTLESVLYALADPTRLEIVKKIASMGCGLNCQSAAPADLPKSTQSHHFQILREAGLIKSERRGTEVVNALRCVEIEKRFPGVISSILKASEKAKRR